MGGKAQVIIIVKKRLLYISQDKDALIHDVSFVAKPYEVTAIMSHEAAERRTVVEVISGRRHYGYYGGTIRAKGVGNIKASEDFIAFVPRVCSVTSQPMLNITRPLAISTSPVLPFSRP